MVEIIAEAAQGYFGDNVNRCMALVELSAAAGADGVKFQLVYADEICTQDYKHYELFSSLRMEDEQWRKIANYCAELKIPLYLDIFGTRSLALAESLDVGGVKLHSTDLLNIPLMKELAASSIKRVILATGGSIAPEIVRAVDILKNKSLVLMHGFQGYPTENGDNQIARMNWLQKHFGEHEIGFADHVPEDDAARLWLSAVAIGAGAQVLEKHITRSVVLRDEDHEAALGGDEFALYVANMRVAQSAFVGATDADDFGMTDSEHAYRKNMKKHVVARNDLEAGRVLNDNDLRLIRTMEQGNIHFDVAALMGQKLRVSRRAGQAIKWEDVE